MRSLLLLALVTLAGCSAPPVPPTARTVPPWTPASQPGVSVTP